MNRTPHARRHRRTRLERLLEHNMPRSSKNLALMEHNMNRPINSRLPPEVLGLIFLFYVNLGVVENHEYGARSFFGRFKGSTTSPTTLLGVCLYWCTIAKSIQALWSDIYILNALDPHVHLAGTWLKRSGNSLLSLRLECFGPYKAPRKILSLFLDHLQRWKKIQFCLTEPAWVALRELDRLPRPHRLEFVIATADTFEPLPENGRYISADLLKEETKQIIRCLYSLPSVRHAEFVGQTAPVDIKTFQSLTNLTKLTYLMLANTRACAHTLPMVLSLCPLLQFLRVDPVGIPPTGCVGREHAWPMGIVRQRNLQTLFFYTATEDLACFLSTLELPSLKSFTWFNQRAQPQIYVSLRMEYLLIFFERSKCPLEYLQLDNVDLPEAELNRTLSSGIHLSLRHLGIVKTRIPSTTVDLLNLRKFRYMPNLSHLMLHFSEGKDGMLGDMLRSRIDARPVGFKKLYVASVGTNNGNAYRQDQKIVGELLAKNRLKGSLVQYDPRQSDGVIIVERL